MNRVDGKVALVTGGGSGIGRSVCQTLAAAGAKVVVTGRSSRSIEETVKIIINAGGEAIAVKLDVTNEDDWEQVMATTLSQYKKLNVLVNNAGVYIDRGLFAMPLSDWKEMININLDGPFLGIRSAIKAMKDNNESNSIVNISSTGALYPSPLAAYSVSKAGMSMLAKCAALMCGIEGYNIRVNTVYPGVTKGGKGQEVKETEAYQSVFFTHYPGTERIGELMDVAKSVLFLASDDSSHITSADLVIDGGASQFCGGVQSVSFGKALVNMKS